MRIDLVGKSVDCACAAGEAMLRASKDAPRIWLNDGDKNLLFNVISVSSLIILKIMILVFCNASGKCKGATCFGMIADRGQD